MPEIPIFCDTCGTPLHSGIFATHADVTLGKITAGPCPVCGGFGTLSNVVVTATQDAMRIIGSGIGGAAEIERLRSLIERVRLRHATPEQLVAELEQGDTTWKRLSTLLSQLLIPKDAGQFYGLLALIVAVLPLLQEPKEELTKEKISAIVDTAVQQVLDKAPTAKTNLVSPSKVRHPTHVSAKKKIGRNQACPCASGKKYKKCCGDFVQH